MPKTIDQRIAELTAKKAKLQAVTDARKNLEAAKKALIKARGK